MGSNIVGLVVMWKPYVVQLMKLPVYKTFFIGVTVSASHYCYKLILLHNIQPIFNFLPYSDCTMCFIDEE